MLRRVAYLAVSLTLVALLSGCGFSFFRFEKREAWRDATEAACLAAGKVTPSAGIAPMSRIKGPSVCGLNHPFKVTALHGGAVNVATGVTLGCPMIAALEVWLRETVEPAAYAAFGMPVVEIVPLSSYACRPINNIRGEQLSEHAFGNAIDVGAFILADGRKVTVEKGWRGARDEQYFLRAAIAGACQEFYTVLGPGADMFHYNHFHLDLRASNGRSQKHYCRPDVQFLPRQEGVPMSMAPPSSVGPGVDPVRTGAVRR